LIFKYFLISNPNYKGLRTDQTKGHGNLDFYALLVITALLEKPSKFGAN
jgi:hypothetical protein